jgi:hypothetical protein
MPIIIPASFRVPVFAGSGHTLLSWFMTHLTGLNISRTQHSVYEPALMLF